MSTLALNGGTPVHDSKARPWPEWPPSTKDEWPRFEPGLREVFLSRTEGVPNPRGRRFAKAFCDYLGTQYGLLTTCGSAALKLALSAVTDTDGLGDNGECIVPNYTFVACATMPLEMGFSVKFVDIDPETACIDPAAVEAAIGTRTRVIMPVDLSGHPADMERINAIARKHNLAVVEDACQSHGAAYKGKKCGGLGDAGCFSFQSTKNLTCGEGGFVTTNSQDVYKRAYALHNLGKAPPGMSLKEPHVGYNYRVSEYMATLLETRLKDMDAQMERRTRAVAYLTKELKGITGLRPAQVADYTTTHAYHLFRMIYTPSAFGGHSRDEFIEALKAEGIPCTNSYEQPLSKIGAMRAVKKRHPEMLIETPCPNVDRVIADTVGIQQATLLADDRDLADIPEAIRKVQKAFHA
jgi:dTDP-4-amino-4,6-dideoxygalactose transaminase